MRVIDSELRIAEAPDPKPAPGQLVIEVAAAGVNRADLMQAKGKYPPPPGASEVFGLECSGVVSALGPDVTDFQLGDEVCALLEGGGYAERALASAKQVLPRPDGVSLVDSAGLPEAVCTVWSNLMMLAHLRSGESVLVHGGGSGIGTAAIQLAKAAGATVLVTAGNSHRGDRCLELGADHAIDYRQTDFLTEVRERTDGRGVDVILDIVGGAYLPRNLDALATGGRLVVIALQDGRRGELDLGTLLAKRAAVIGSTLRSRPAAEKAAIVESVREYVWPLIADDWLRPVIDRTLPLEDAAEAHRAMRASEHFGKILLKAPARHPRHRIG